MGKASTRSLSKEDTQKAMHEKMLKITSHQAKASQNHNEIPLHTQDGYNKKR